MMVGAFVGCNGVLDRPPLTTSNDRENPGCFDLSLRSGAPRRRVEINPKNQS
jgi:hypothetical protein